MKIGTFLHLEYRNMETEQIEKYRCKIIEKNEEFLFIDFPVNIKTKRTAILLTGAHVIANYIARDNSIYRFKTKIVAKVNLPIPALAIEYPKKDDIKRIQRRKYVRIDTAVDVAIHSVEDKFQPFTSITVDISGGGLSVIFPKGNIQIEKKDQLQIWMVLHMSSGMIQYINANAEVIRIKRDNNAVATISLKFISISNQDRQTIIRYCFEKQREARRKELL